MANKTGIGGFKPGVSGNILGRPSTGFQNFKDRLQHLLEVKTIYEIEKMVTDKSEWNNLSAIDAMLARRIFEATEKKGGEDFVRVLDRFLGKPAQAVELSGSLTLGLAQRLDEADKLSKDK